jgi:thiol-disulfide isomerase/thioredoxin
MQKIFLLLLLVIISCQPKNQKEADSTKESSSVIQLADLENNSIELNSKITILNLWATWCKPCIAEMPDLAEMQAQLPEGFQLLLASDELLERQLKFIERQSLGLEFVQLKSSLESLGVYALPTTLVIDSNGKILETMVGARAWNTPEQIANIKAYLK